MHSNLENQNIYLAPMEDVTDYPFRQVLLKVGRPDVFFTEFVNVNGLTSKGRNNVVHRLHFSKKEKPIILQLWGREPEKFKKALDFVKDFDFDGVNINMGCPVKKVLKVGCGAALINEFEVVSDIIEAFKFTKVPVSIKTRVGENGFDMKWIQFLLSLNLHSLFIHGRSREQKFQGIANWDYIEEVVKLRDFAGVDTRVIGNGDVLSMEQASSFKNRYGVDGVMIGRQVLKNPWVFSGREDLSADERIDTLLYHLKEMRVFVNKFEGKNWQSVKSFYYGYLRESDSLVSIRKKLFEINDLDESINYLVSNNN